MNIELSKDELDIIVNWGNDILNDMDYFADNERDLLEKLEQIKEHNEV